MLRSPNVHYKSSDLFSILRDHFGKDMNLARIKAMSMMICTLCKVQRIAYTKLASAFDNEAGAGSSLRRIQRLIAEWRDSEIAPLFKEASALDNVTLPEEFWDALGAK